MTSSSGNIFRITGPLWRKFSGHRWITLTKARDAELWCILWRLNKRLSKQSWGWWFETPYRSLWRHCNALWRTKFWYGFIKWCKHICWTHYSQPFFFAKMCTAHARYPAVFFQRTHKIHLIARPRTLLWVRNMNNIHLLNLLVMFVCLDK